VSLTTPDTRTPAQTATSTPAPADTRTPDQIESDMAATRARLTGRIAEIEAYVHPKAVAGRQLARAKGYFVDEFGGIRPERVLAAAGVAVAVVGLLVLRRRHRH
jgi:hypothetical protein